MSEMSRPHRHSHQFLGQGHDQSERRGWAVIALCGGVMVIEIAGGLLFGSIALVADGLHMSTHAGALLLAAAAYRYARKHAGDRRFSFGTGKLGDLAGFSSAIMLAMIALLIGYDATIRLFQPVPIHFAAAIPIACLGLAVNVASVWLLGGGHRHEHEQGHDQAEQRIVTPAAAVILEIFEQGAPPRFRLHRESGLAFGADDAVIETVRPDGTRQLFVMADRGFCLESVDEIPQPHSFAAEIRIAGHLHRVAFAEHVHGPDALHRDHNMRAAIVHVMADAAISVLVIVGLLMARTLGWLWLDPLAGIAGACVIASWSYGLIRDTGAILLDMVPKGSVEDGIARTVDGQGDQLNDLHVWRLGPGHLGAILSVSTPHGHGPDYYRARLARFTAISHLTVEVHHC